jgi:bifunctional non-homologous end joining protein LigD
MARESADPLQRYRSKRDFDKTPEPTAQVARRPRGNALSYVIQKHGATRLHYDLRLELDGVLLSWAVPKGPSFDPADKRMAVRTEDHPLAYGGFEGVIPEGHYGAGRVIVWDRGQWTPVGDPHAGLAAGKLAFDLTGHKLRGRWEMVRMKPRAREKQEAWLLFKKSDANARPRSEYDVVAALPDSVLAKEPPPVRAEGGAASGAVKAPLPATLSPQLAQLASTVPAGGEWILENKFDGYRVLTRIARGVPKLFTRGGHDWTAKLPALASALRELNLKSAWLDGEIVVPRQKGERSGDNFNALQNAFDQQRTQNVVYQLFDLPYFEGHDLREAPLYARRELLRQLLDQQGSPLLQFSAELEGDAATALRAACEQQREGVIAKRRDAPYRSARSDSWQKLKCRQRQEFVIGGFIPRSDASDEVGSLLLGVHDAEGRLVHAGRVGTGWGRQTGRDLRDKLSALAQKATPFAGDEAARGRWSPKGGGNSKPTWVRPELVAEVQFAEWTPAGQVRQAAFVGLRGDKPVKAITREAAAAPVAAPPRRHASKPSIAISHPERVIDDSTGLTKLDLVRYYDSVAEWLLPHLKGRPVALLRAPSGIGGQQFFQRHLSGTRIAGVRELDPALWPGHEALIEVPSHPALIAAAQMNVIEFHTWNATAANIDKPDRMVFDLDPGEGVSWPTVREGASLVRALLEQLGLRCWLKTSGGKGLHVVVPIAPRWTHDVVKAFSRAIVQHLAHTIPARFVAVSGPSRRVGKVFVDYLRNGHDATTAAAFSARARPGMGVSMTLDWEALGSVRSSAEWTIANARDHLSLRRTDPWAEYGKTRQSLTAPMKTLGFKAQSTRQSQASKRSVS